MGVGLVEKAAGAEVPEHTALHDTLEAEPVMLVEQAGVVEAHSSVGDLREDAVEDDESGKGSGLAAVPSPENRA